MIDSVAGTRIHEALDDDRARTLLLSDLHIPLDGGGSLPTLDALLRSTPAGTRVLVLGDLFDAYVGEKQLAHGACASVCEMLAAATRRGLSVSVLHGNRDFLLDAAFERRTGCRVVPGGLRFRLGGRACLALHGDELCLNDRPYQRAKRVLRHPLAKALVRSLPLPLALRLSGAARKKSMSTTGSGDPERFHPVASAVDEAFACGVELLVFGHIHRAARGERAPGREYRILPAFEADGVHLAWQDGELCYRDRAGRVVPDPAPRTFASLAPRN